MDEKPNTRHISSHADAGERPPTPYPLGPGAIELWLRRGETLGRALHWTAMTIAAVFTGVSRWLRHAAGRNPTNPPPEPG
jgi:hypothetical protein